MLSFNELKEWCEDKGLKHRVTKVHGDANLERKVVHFFEKEDEPVVMYSEISKEVQVYFNGYGHDTQYKNIRYIHDEEDLQELYNKVLHVEWETSKTKKIFDQALENNNFIKSKIKNT